MVVEASMQVARAGRAVRFALLALFTLYVGHDAIFVAQYGIGPRLDRVMTETGHTPHWVGLGFLALAAGGVLAAWSVRAIVPPAIRAPGGRGRRRQMARGADRRLPSPRFDGYLREVVDLWPPLFVATLATFALLENVEHLGAEGHLLGLGALTGPEYPLAIPVLAIVTGLVSAVGALVRWRILALRRRVARANRPAPVLHRRAPAPVGWRSIAAERVRRSLLDRPDPGRAPPVVFPA